MTPSTLHSDFIHKNIDLSSNTIVPTLKHILCPGTRTPVKQCQPPTAGLPCCNPSCNKVKAKHPSLLERGRQTVSGISGGHSHVLARGLEAFLALKPREFKEILTYRIYGKAFEQLKVELALFFLHSC